MSDIKEFSQEYFDEHTTKENRLFNTFIDSKEPYKSIFQNNPWMIPPDIKRPLEWGDHYWDTTVARKHDYWKNFELPSPTKDIVQIRQDFKKWGYALIEDALSEIQCQNFLDRVLEQAAGEKLAGLDAQTPSGQYVHTLINKGEVFGKCIEQNPEAVQAGVLIENFLNETLYTNINLVEQFNPLIKVDMEFKNSIRFLLEMKKDRALSLSLDNNLLTESAGMDYSIGLGYRVKDLKFRNNIGGRQSISSGDLNIKADINYRDNITIIRNLDILDNKVTAGQSVWSFKLSADYALSKNFNAVFEVLEREKSNQTIKGDLIKSAFITSTMGVSYKIQ